MKTLMLLLMFVACVPSTSFSQQIIYGGSFGAVVTAPSGWEFQPATAQQQERDHILAIYKLKKAGLDQASIYITVIPLEIRKPESIDKEIGYDRKMSERGGLVLVKTTKAKTGGREYAINTWQGQGFVRHVGLSPTKSGVLLVVGTTNSKAFGTSLYEGVSAIVTSAVPMEVFTVGK